ncbi:GNAT family N-acetyltransferase [Flavobacterium frigoris]|uniref:Acetyltransferase n=1 Tax=Flavobacterium frigoris (strain PS1) TaxID=1086011 RepID=H7FME1_FLAFP|nr:GNAT family N-acetyltransferase [Flavobacterium frigoris]EIA10315.1 putative acetyltransferase [Flavobacterium frigoris PS1]
MGDQIKIVKTTSENKDFIALVGALDKSLWEAYPELKSNYWGNNIIELNPNVVIVYVNDVAVACACFKKYNKDTIEIKRMFVSVEERGKGLAQNMLQELESWAKEKEFSFAVLETLYKQKAAIKMYQKVGYVITDNYAPYIGLENSICMRKHI